jgi:hypothetical protein
MKTRFNWMMKFAAMALVIAATTVLRATAAQVTATLDSASIALGDTAQLTVSISGGDSTQPELPAVSGLEFTLAGQSISFESINGAVTSSVSLTYQVTPDRVGTFTIPAIRLAGGGSSQPLTLQVLAGASGATAASSANLPTPNMSSGTTDATDNASGQPAFLRVVMPKQQLYAGELVPVQVKAYFSADMSASLDGLPVLNSDAFTLNKLDAKPDQTQEVIGGQPYNVLIWASALTAVKTGDYALNLELPVVERVQQRGQGGNDSPFNDPFFNQFFSRTVDKPLTLHSGSQNVKVLPLPAAGRPADFSGAVGRFEVSSEAAPPQLTAGDPITLRLKVSGQGNFDRVYSSGLAASAEWKTYPPSAQFTPADNAGYGGSKTFEEAVVPLKAGQEKIPAITFSYFDPDTRQYVTRSTIPIAIEVAPGSGVSSVAASPASLAALTSSLSANTSAPELAPNKVEAGNFVSSLQPVLFAPWFVAAQGVPVMALITGLFVQRRRQRLAQDSERTRNRAAQAAVREHLEAMEQALAANSAPAFFTAARQAVQAELARRWQLSTSQVTAAEINLRMNGDAGDLGTLFAVADDVVYSGQHVPPAELQRWKDTVIHQLKQLEEP